MKKITFIFGTLLLLCHPAEATTRYLAAASAGSANGSSCDNALALSATNYTTLETASSAGDTIELCDNVSYSSSITITKSGSLAAGTTFTVNTGTDVFTSTSHGLANGDAVVLSTSGTFPAVPVWTSTGHPEILEGQGATLDQYWTYFVRDVSGNTFKICKYVGGPAMDVTSAGTGTHTIQKINFFTVRGAGTVRATAPAITGSRATILEINTATNNMSGGNTLVSFANGVNYVKLENLRVNNVATVINANSFENDHIWIKNILVNNTREAILARGLATCYGGGQVYCPTASHGWVIENFDADYFSKHGLRSELGFHHYTIVNSDGDSRFILGDFPVWLHFGTGSGSAHKAIYFTGASGSLSAGQTVTSGTSGATLTVVGVTSNPIIATAGWIQNSTSSGTFAAGHALSNGAGWTATAGGSNFAGYTWTSASYGQIINCVSRRQAEVVSTSAWNGDGFVAEELTQGIYFENSYAFDTADGGFDLKAGPHYINGSVSMRDGQRPYRFWGRATMNNCFGGWSRQGEVTQNAITYPSPIWAGGNVTAKFCTFLNNAGNLNIATGGQNGSTYSSGTGTVPIIGSVITGQTTGATRIVTYYSGNAASGTLAVSEGNDLTFQVGEVISGSGFSALVGTDFSGTACGRIDLIDSVVALDKSHAGVGTTILYSNGCSGTYTETRVALWDEAAGVGTNPQFQNGSNKYWDIANVDFSNPFQWSAVGDFINEDTPQVMTDNSMNSALYTNTKGYYNVVTEEQKTSVTLSGVSKP